MSNLNPIQLAKPRLAVVAECAAPFLQTDGLAIIAEPPEDPAGERWPASGYEKVGWESLAEVTTPFHLKAFRQVTLCPDTYPRRTGVPTKRPLW